MKYLKEIRKKNNLLQKDIAKKLNISISAYSNYEQGLNEPSITTLIQLAKIFNTSIDYLLTGNQNINNTTIETKFDELDKYINKLTNIEYSKIKEHLELILLKKKHKDNNIIELLNQLTPQQFNMIIKNIEGFIEYNNEKK